MNFDDLVHSGIYFQALRLAIDIELFEKIESGNNTLESLKSSMSLADDQRSLTALLSLLNEMGLICFDSKLIQNTKLTKRKLIKSSKESETDLIKFIDEQFIPEIRSCGKKILIDGNHPSQAQRPWEKPIEELDKIFYESTEKAEKLSESLSQKAFEAGRDIADVLPFESFDSLVDLGGNDGSFVIPILKKNKNLKAKIFDLPVLGKKAKSRILENGLEERLTFEEGSFFHTEIPQAECYLLRLVLHDFSDEACIKILKSVAQKMRQGDRLVIVENVTDNPAAKERKHILAANLYLTLHGEFFGHQSRERKTNEYIQLIEQSGLQIIERAYQKNIILICGKENEEKRLIRHGQSKGEIDLCHVISMFGSKKLSIKLDSKGNLFSFLIKSKIRERELVFKESNKIYPICTLFSLIKSISLIDKGEYYQTSERGGYVGRKVEVTYLKGLFPKLKYARRTAFIKQVNMQWGLYDFENKRIDII